MSETLDRIKVLAARGALRASQHAIQELKADTISLEEVVYDVASAVLVEDYPAGSKGPSVLVKQLDASGNAIRLVWGSEGAGWPGGINHRLSA